VGAREARIAAQERRRKEEEEKEKRRKEAEEKRRKEQRARESVERRQAVWRAASERGVEHLVHFVDIRAVPSILRNGVIPRLTLLEDGHRFCGTDEQRRDGCPNGTCCSVSFPNSLYFSRARIDPSRTFAVLKLGARDVLLGHRCGFYWMNAAANEFWRYRLFHAGPPYAARLDVDVERYFRERCSEHRFKEMFAEVLPDGQRRVPETPRFCPTHLQAEVIVFGIISSACIEEIVLENERDMERCGKMINASPPRSVGAKNCFAGRRQLLLGAQNQV
jgi:hypothetical protein